MSLALQSLQQGTWVKLICGASFHHLPSISNLALIYTLAGVDCIDLAADPAVVKAAQQGITWAKTLRPDVGIPLLMASFHDGEDPHFRKARLLDSYCPPNCPQPCLRVCPPQAIQTQPSTYQVSIQTDLCYGCGRCQPVCPHQLIGTEGYHLAADRLLPPLLAVGIRALEIHTQPGRLAEFQQLWQHLQPWLRQLHLLSISCPDGADLVAYLGSLLTLMQPADPPPLIWQTDGRPMSGDIGAGTTKATLRLAQKVAQMGLPGYIQLAGGTNAATLPQIKSDVEIAGIAYGSYARQLVAFAADHPNLLAEADLLQEAIDQASRLIAPVKSREYRPHS
ncbi:MAG: LdpA C-terminal domain-containing domain [Cyanobacteriota bacterium]|nr:LdpA C-terminal domain-containing domain [Cyanobacteriota bacterium]